MPWTEEETIKFQMDNSEHLAEINKTLMPDSGLSGKIGIFCPGQAGDTGVVTSVLKYRNIVFPGKEIVWFINYPNADLLKFAPISEIRMWPWAGNGLPIGTPDFYPLLCDENNRLNKKAAKQYELTKDLEDGWFPTPWMLPVKKRHGLQYSECSKKVFGIPDHFEWHPMLHFSFEEYRSVWAFTNKIGGVKKVFIESFAGSGQSLIDEEMIRRSMDICSEQWPGCKFVFGSHKFLKTQEAFPDNFFDNENVFSSAEFTVRQCALIAAECDLMISVSSGITVATSCWHNKAIPIIQFAGSKICSTQIIANGRFELITADDKPFENAKMEFYLKLISLLSLYK